MKPTVTLQDLAIGYRLGPDATAVASHLSASLYGGGLTCLLGPNGVGKSTLLRTLARFQPALSGQVLLSGRPLTDFTPHELARTVGVVLTSRPESHRLSVAEVVGLGRSPYTGFWGTLSASDKAIVDEALRQVNISHLAHRDIASLSDGERQKTMIAKALAQQTPVILLDEPTAFLDYPSKVETLQLLRSLAHRLEKTVLLSTHDVALALQLADTLWLMQQTHNSGDAESPSSPALVVGTPCQLADSGHLAAFIEKGGITLDAASLTIRIKG